MGFSFDYTVLGVVAAVMVVILGFFKYLNNKHKYVITDANDEFYSNLTYNDKSTDFKGDASGNSDFLNDPYTLDDFDKDENFNKNLNYIDEDDDVELVQDDLTGKRK